MKTILVKYIDSENSAQVIYYNSKTSLEFGDFEAWELEQAIERELSQMQEEQDLVENLGLSSRYITQRLKRIGDN